MLLDLKGLISKYNLNITGVIHIGGHHGEEMECYRSIETIQNIVMFEPDPNSFNVLKETVKDENVVLINKGLGPFSCKVDLHIEKENRGASNSVLEPDLHLRQYPWITFKDKLEIQLHPLDKYEPNKSLNFINIDVQGFELEVFRGAKKTLNNVDYILSEVNRDEVYKNCARVEEIDEFLGKYGFKRVETTWDGGIWGDAFYIKKK